MDWRSRLLALSTSLLVGAGTLVGGAALAAPAGSLLKGLSLPLPKPAASLFAANAIGQTSLNTQLPGNPEELLAKVRASLAKQGYSERKINTVVGPWGFNLVLDPPSGTKVDGTRWQGCRPGAAGHRHRPQQAQPQRPLRRALRG